MNIQYEMHFYFKIFIKKIIRKILYLKLDTFLDIYFAQDWLELIWFLSITVTELILQKKDMTENETKK